jgi:hypothetical protein
VRGLGFLGGHPRANGGARISWAACEAARVAARMAHFTDPLLIFILNFSSLDRYRCIWLHFSVIPCMGRINTCWGTKKLDPFSSLWGAGFMAALLMGGR